MASPGTLVSLASLPGTQVNQGDEIATLVNRQVHLEYLQAKGRYESQRELVQSIRRSRLELPEVANFLPGQMFHVRFVRPTQRAGEAMAAGLEGTGERKR